jgi:hypothetical protein
MIVHQIEALRDAGVTEVVLAINYQPQVMYSFIEEYQAKLGVKITISQARGAAWRGGGARAAWRARRAHTRRGFRGSRCVCVATGALRCAARTWRHGARAGARHATVRVLRRRAVRCAAGAPALAPTC